MGKLPTGISDFRELRERGCVYVDKTQYVYKMVEENKYVFISRPRRFGKSLTVSVLEYLFKGERGLFEGTWIFDKWDWQEFPVVRLDMNEVDSTSPENLTKSILLKLKRIAEEYGTSCVNGTVSDTFYYLVQDISRKSKKPVVLLIDEYEKPILDHISDKQSAHQMREILRQLYGRIKSLDGYLRFVFFTGITKYTKAGVFSTLNNLVDISFHEDFAQMFGYTLEEIVQYFPEYIDAACEKLGMSREYLLEQLEKYYGGFSFDGKHFVFNPFSVLLFFYEKNFANYWSETAQPSFLYNYLKGRDVRLEDILERKTISRMELMSQEIEETTVVSFLVQAGYLTFKRKVDANLYEVGFPNIDAGQAVAQMILELEYGLRQYELEDKGSELRKAIREERVEDMMRVIEELFGSMSYMSYAGMGRVCEVEKLEAHYSQLMYALLFGAGVKCEMEREVARGRVDIWFTNDGVGYVMELKVDKSAQEALEQIKERGYERLCGTRRCYLIGVNFNSKERKIEWAVEVRK
ncbi:ATP-binding protein [Fervidobacterium thailandense]|uniref:AAA-ATPase-like domain-containing protein n=1 Tax=Fervidobacterium thailandense TaxID=1008305 RepID=A0A1E3G5S1_9BACT|nr:ATP-binding protein [Fervidobacterium thailandense]ODN31213.1 hypothetical protein A4H02_00035 [Fervidobacterium thailandense]